MPHRSLLFLRPEAPRPRAQTKSDARKPPTRLRASLFLHHIFKRKELTTNITRPPFVVNSNHLPVPLAPTCIRHHKIDDRLSYPKSLSSIQFFLHVFTLIQVESVSGITSSQSDFLLASPQLTISPGHFTLIYPAAAGKLTTERPEPRFRRQFLPISRKWPELEAAVPGRVGAVLPARPYFFAAPRQHAPVFPV